MIIEFSHNQRDKIYINFTIIMPNKHIITLMAADEIQLINIPDET